MTGPATPICAQFNRQAEHYDRQAGLQRAIAWRLAQRICRLTLPAGPRLDLGAGSGLMGQALQQLDPELSLLQVDGSAALLARNPLAHGHQASLLWDLDQDLPQELHHCGLITSSFSLQWLQQPHRALQHWAGRLAPGGWLVLAVPVAGSFPQWHQACARAQVPCTAKALPEAAALVASASASLTAVQRQHLVFSRRYGPGGRAFLRQLQLLGAGHSEQPPLQPSQWRQLLRHWPADDRVSWHILVLIGQR